MGSLLLCFLLYLQPLQGQDSLAKALDKSEGAKKVSILNELCRQYLNNDPEKARDFAEHALELSSAIGDSLGIAASHNNIGLFYKNKGTLDKALASYMVSAGIQERNLLELGLANTLGNIGTIYSIEGEHDVALDYFRQASNIFLKLNSQEQLVGAFNNIGNVFIDQKLPDSALLYYQKSLAIYEAIPDNSNTFVPFESIGNIYFQKGEMEAAMAYYQSAYDLDRFKGNTNGMASALHNIGVVLRSRRNFEKALTTFNDALELAQTTNNLRLMSIIYQSLAETYFEKGDTFMAYSFQRLHDTAKDSLFSEESTRLIAQMEAVYEMEKMEDELAALQLESEVQQLRIKNDKIIILAIIIISIVGISLTTVIIKELQLIKRNKKLVEEQKRIIEDKNKSITYSIDYAKSIQKSLLNYTVSTAKRSKFFIFFEPKDIVSGDFYWYKEKGDIDIIAVADCTGHGVAGAFMTVIGHAALEQIINKDGVDEPAEILQRLNTYIQESLKNNVGEIMNHSMDIALCKVDRKSKILTYSGVNRPLIYIANGELKEIKGTKIIQGEEELVTADFVSEQIEYSADHTFYMFTDGFPDQFGGDTNKKYMMVRFKKLLKQINPLDFEMQKDRLKKEIMEWRAQNEQTDDIAVLGFRP
ncbi:MAG: tetratricopeptide repeat protein [Bacteroidota bacterium]